MKKIDVIMIALFLILSVAFLILRDCQADIYFFAVNVVAAILIGLAILIQGRRIKKIRDEEL